MRNLQFCFLATLGSVKNPRTVGCPHQALSKSPVGTENVHEGEGHREGTEEDVGDGQVGDQDVTGRPHALETAKLRVYFQEKTLALSLKKATSRAMLATPPMMARRLYSKIRLLWKGSSQLEEGNIEQKYKTKTIIHNPVQAMSNTNLPRLKVPISSCGPTNSLFEHLNQFFSKLYIHFFLYIGICNKNFLFSSIRQTNVLLRQYALLTLPPLLISETYSTGDLW